MKVKLIEASSEIGAGTRGASMGMDALRVAAWRSGSAFFGRVEEVQVLPRNGSLYQADETPFAHRIAHLVDFQQKLSEQVAKSLNDGNLTVVVAGDHANAIGSVSGSKSAAPAQRLGVVWVDAHADLHTPYSTPSGNVHGMPLAALLNFDNKELQINEPSADSNTFWEQLKSVGGSGAKVAPEDIVFIALRDTEKEEDALIEQHNIKVIRVEELREKGAEQAVADTLAHLADCERIHVSFDVDSLDTSISRGTGTPVDNGLLLDEAKTLLAGLMTDQRSATLDVVEINPALDDRNKMAEAVLSIMDTLTPVFESR